QELAAREYLLRSRCVLDEIERGVVWTDDAKHRIAIRSFRDRRWIQAASGVDVAQTIEIGALKYDASLAVAPARLQSGDDLDELIIVDLEEHGDDVVGGVFERERLGETED